MLGVRIPPGLPALIMNPAEKIKGWFENAKQFYSDVRSEMRKISWPARQEVIGTTIVVVVAVFFFGFYLGLIDYLLAMGLDRVIRYFSGTGGA
jgi:preprotein translocase subunit SecE